MKTYLKYQSPYSQFLAFLGLAGAFIILDTVVSMYFFRDITGILLNKNAEMSPALSHRFKLAQFASATLTFIVPGLLFGYYSSPKALPYVGIRKSVSPILLGASALLLITIQPFVGWLGDLNARINFGQFQKQILEMEAMYNRALKVFLQMNNFGELIINLLVMALLPAIGEELFFRGSLQKALLRLSNKPWVAILLSSAVFALLHGTYYKILPIFTLGLILGVVYYVTRNLWYTILIHFLNNSFAVLSVYYADKSETLRKLSSDDLTVPIYAAVVSLVIGVGIIYFIKKKSDEVLPEVFANEDNDFIA